MSLRSVRCAAAQVQNHLADYRERLQANRMSGSGTASAGEQRSANTDARDYYDVMRWAGVQTVPPPPQMWSFDWIFHTRRRG
jgi:hypothetical protein